MEIWEGSTNLHGNLIQQDANYYCHTPDGTSTAQGQWASRGPGGGRAHAQRQRQQRRRLGASFPQKELEK